MVIHATFEWLISDNVIKELLVKAFEKGGLQSFYFKLGINLICSA